MNLRPATIFAFISGISLGCAAGMKLSDMKLGDIDPDSYITQPVWQSTVQPQPERARA